MFSFILFLFYYFHFHSIIFVTKTKAKPCLSFCSVICNVLFGFPFFPPTNILKICISLTRLFVTHPQTATSSILLDVQHSAHSHGLLCPTYSFFHCFRSLDPVFIITLWAVTTDFLVLKDSGLCFKSYLFELPTSKLVRGCFLLEFQWEQRLSYLKSCHLEVSSFILLLEAKAHGYRNLGLSGAVLLSECHIAEMLWMCRLVWGLVSISHQNTCFHLNSSVVLSSWRVKRDKKETEVVGVCTLTLPHISSVIVPTLHRGPLLQLPYSLSFMPP